MGLACAALERWEDALACYQQATRYNGGGRVVLV
jgi:hypothetical protein